MPESLCAEWGRSVPPQIDEGYDSDADSVSSERTSVDSSIFPPSDADFASLGDVDKIDDEYLISYPDYDVENSPTHDSTLDAASVKNIPRRNSLKSTHRWVDDMASVKKNPRPGVTFDVSDDPAEKRTLEQQLHQYLSSYPSASPEGPIETETETEAFFASSDEDDDATWYQSFLFPEGPPSSSSRTPTFSGTYPLHLFSGSQRSLGVIEVEDTWDDEELLSEIYRRYDAGMGWRGWLEGSFLKSVGSILLVEVDPTTGLPSSPSPPTLSSNPSPSPTPTYPAPPPRAMRDRHLFMDSLTSRPDPPAGVELVERWSPTKIGWTVISAVAAVLAWGRAAGLGVGGEAFGFGVVAYLAGFAAAGSILFALPTGSRT